MWPLIHLHKINEDVTEFFLMNIQAWILFWAECQILSNLFD